MYTSPICPECWNAIPKDDYLATSNLAICRSCGVAFELSTSELLEELIAIDLNALPPNFRIRDQKSAYTIDQYHRWCRPILRSIKFIGSLLLLFSAILAVSLILHSLPIRRVGVPEWEIAMVGCILIGLFLMCSLLIIWWGLRSCHHMRLTLRPVDETTCNAIYSGMPSTGNLLFRKTIPLRHSTRIDFFVNRKWNGTFTEKTIRVTTDGKSYLFGGELDSTTHLILAAVLVRKIHQLSPIHQGIMKTRDPKESSAEFAENTSESSSTEFDPAIRCPYCCEPIPFMNLAVSQNITYCPGCEQTFSLEQCARLSEIDRVDLSVPCPGIAVQNTPQGLRIVTGNFLLSVICHLLILPMFCVMIAVSLATKIAAILVLFMFNTVWTGMRRYRIEIGVPNESGNMEMTLAASFFGRKEKQTLRYASQISQSLVPVGKSKRGFMWVILIAPVPGEELPILSFGHDLPYTHQQYLVALLRAVLER